jgi:hypothetical protein
MQTSCRSNTVPLRRAQKAITKLEICVQIAVVAAGNLLRGFTKLVEWIFISAVYLTEILNSCKHDYLRRVYCHFWPYWMVFVAEAGIWNFFVLFRCFVALYWSCYVSCWFFLHYSKVSFAFFWLQDKCVKEKQCKWFFAQMSCRVSVFLRNGLATDFSFL